MVQFLDPVLTICNKDCHFKQVSNRAIKEINYQIVKKMRKQEEKVDDFTDNGEDIQVAINLLNEKLQAYQQMGNAEKIIETVDQLEEKHKELKKVRKEMRKYQKNMIDIMNKNDNQIIELYGKKAELLFDNITKKEFIDNCSPIDIGIMRNVDYYHQQALIGVSENEIKEKIEEDIKLFQTNTHEQITRTQNGE